MLKKSLIKFGRKDFIGSLLERRTVLSSAMPSSYLCEETSNYQSMFKHAADVLHTAYKSLTEKSFRHIVFRYWDNTRIVASRSQSRRNVILVLSCKDSLLSIYSIMCDYIHSRTEQNQILYGSWSFNQKTTDFTVRNYYQELEEYCYSLAEPKKVHDAFVSLLRNKNISYAFIFMAQENMGASILCNC